MPFPVAFGSPIDFHICRYKFVQVHPRRHVHALVDVFTSYTYIFLFSHGPMVRFKLSASAELECLET